MTLMLMGIGSSKTIIEVIRGYTGDKGANQIYNNNDQINLFNVLILFGEVTLRIPRLLLIFLGFIK